MGRIGIIGGSGLYHIEGLTGVREVELETPFGAPSDAFIVGELDGAGVVFLSRHGRGHRLTPTEVPYLANIWGMKKLGVDWIMSVSAVGSLKEEIVPGHVVLVDQFIDRTRQRRSTFFGEGVVGHVPFGDPVCETLRGYMLASARQAGAVVHDRGTYVCMEGPAFSTRAESNLYRAWGASVVGMTNLPEAKLAREAGISYATFAMSTDYDCWHEGHDDVTVEQVVAVVNANVALAKAMIRGAIPAILAHEGPPPHQDAAQFAVMTSPEAIPAEALERLEPIIGRYYKGS